ncbi:MAG: TniQ family protein, partial [Blastocatellia bacterium]
HLRQHRAWCPACFGQWRNEGQTIYEPLLWTLQIVRVCPIHHCSLVEVCPCCQRENKLLSNHARAGYCSCCKQRLNYSGEDRLPAEYQIGNDGLEEQLRIAQSAAEMIASARDLPGPPSKELITQNLRTLINHLGGNCKAFGEAIGRHHTIVCSWRDGKHIPQLESVMQICHRLHLPIVEFLTVPIEFRTDRSEMKELFFQNLSSRHHQKPDVREARDQQASSRPPTKQLSPPIQSLPKKEKDRQIRRLLEWELVEECPRGVSALAEEAGYKSSSMIYKNFPDLLRAIVAKRKKYRGTDNRKLIEHGCQALTDALIEVPMPTMAEIAGRLGDFAAESFYYYFPGECRALSQRRAQLREDHLLKMEMSLRAALSEEPPRALSHIAASDGYSLCILYNHQKELCLAISARYAAYQKKETLKRRLALKERIHQIAFELHQSGIRPSKDRIEPMAPDVHPAAIWQILREIEREGAEA